MVWCFSLFLFSTLFYSYFSCSISFGFLYIQVTTAKKIKCKGGWVVVIVAAVKVNKKRKPLELSMHEQSQQTSMQQNESYRLKDSGGFVTGRCEGLTLSLCIHVPELITELHALSSFPFSDDQKKKCGKTISLSCIREKIIISFPKGLKEVLRFLLSPHWTWGTGALPNSPLILHSIFPIKCFHLCVRKIVGCHRAMPYHILRMGMVLYHSRNGNGGRGKIAWLGMCQEGAAGNGLLCNLSRPIAFWHATPELSPEWADV